MLVPGRFFDVIPGQPRPPDASYAQWVRFSFGPPDIYHAERNHQGIGNQIIEPPATMWAEKGAMVRRSRLGGTLNNYERLAA